MGMFLSPVRTLRAAMNDGQWRGVLLTSWLIAAGAAAGVMATPIGRQALVDQWERTAAALGDEVDDHGYARLEELSAYAPAYAVGAALATGPLLIVMMAALVRATLGRNRARQAPFAVVLAVVSHASVILALRQIAAAAAAYLRESTASVMSVGLLFPGLDATSATARSLGFIDLFVVWWLVLLGIGIADLYGRRRRSVVLGCLGAYVVLALAVTAVLAATGGAA
jgi:hypothetical protein